MPQVVAVPDTGLLFENANLPITSKKFIDGVNDSAVAQNR